MTVLELARLFYDEDSRLDLSVPVTFTPSIHAHQTRAAPTSVTTPVPDATQVTFRSPASTITTDTSHQHPLCRPTHIQGFVANATRTDAPP